MTGEAYPAGRLTKQQRDNARRRAEVAIANRHPEDFKRFRDQLEEAVQVEFESAQQRRNKLNQAARKRVVYLFREEFQAAYENQLWAIRIYGDSDGDT